MITITEKELRKMLKDAFHAGCYLVNYKHAEKYGGVKHYDHAPTARDEYVDQQIDKLKSKQQQCKDYHCELYDFGKKDKPCEKQCEGCVEFEIKNF